MDSGTSTLNRELRPWPAINRQEQAPHFPEAGSESIDLSSNPLMGADFRGQPVLQNDDVVGEEEKSEEMSPAEDEEERNSEGNSSKTGNRSSVLEIEEFKQHAIENNDDLQIKKQEIRAKTDVAKQKHISKHPNTDFEFDENVVAQASKNLGSQSLGNGRKRASQGNGDILETEYYGDYVYSSKLVGFFNRLSSFEESCKRAPDGITPSRDILLDKIMSTFKLPLPAAAPHSGNKLQSFVRILCGFFTSCCRANYTVWVAACFIWTRRKGSF